MPMTIHMFRRVISRRARSSLYREVAAAIRQRVAEGLLRPGDRLPSEDYLRHEFGTGRDTIRDAIAVLRNEGLVVSVQGRRHEIRTPPQRERVPLRVGESATARMPTPDECAQLDIDSGIPVIVVGDEIYPADRYELAADTTGEPEAEAA
jgi:DNA-binding GntR family transcriptional regulator